MTIVIISSRLQLQLGVCLSRTSFKFQIYNNSNMVFGQGKE